MCEATHAAVAKAVKERAKFCFQAAKVAADQVKADFNRSMSRKRMAGAVRTCRTSEERARGATSCAGREARTTTSIGSLSGAEQTFSMLCFALAMWQHVGDAVPRDGRVRQERGPHLPEGVAQPGSSGGFREQSAASVESSPLDYKSLLADAGIPKAEIDATTCRSKLGGRARRERRRRCMRLCGVSDRWLTNEFTRARASTRARQVAQQRRRGTRRGAPGSE